MLPIMLIRIGLTFKELQVKERKAVDQLVLSIALTLPEGCELGDGNFMGWRWEKLGEAFEDGAARFAAESRIVSPTWTELDVLGAEVALRCSTNRPSRFLQVSFLRDGKVVSGPIRFEAVFAANTREAQTLAVSRAKHANGIALSLSSGEVGDWGVYEVRLTTAPTTYVPPPKKGFMIIIR